QILMCMEAAILRKATQYSRYGSATHKQVYVYGGLGQGPIELNRNFGMAWGVGGWLVTPFLQKIGPAATQGLKKRVAAELKTPSASAYAGEYRCSKPWISGTSRCTATARRAINI